MNTIRTDLAMEAVQMKQGLPQGVETEDVPGEMPINRVRIVSEAGEKEIGKAMGTYVTIDAPALRDRDKAYEERLCETFARELRILLKGLEPKAPVMVVGLGNSGVTPDSLGPKVAEKVMVTRHIFEFLPDQIDERMRPVCALTPGVLGVTGIESAELVKGVCQRVKPAAVLAVDALACRQANRISTTVQMSNSGISPGGGIGNKRMALDEKTLGVPVIAIGIPMVVYAFSIAHDALEVLQGKLEKKADLNEIQNVADEVVHAVAGELLVTPKEIDAIIEDTSRLLSDGINLALHDGVSLEEVRRFMQ
ncbi:MAG: GPR endopeptidase [Christensenellales bacterium]